MAKRRTRSQKQEYAWFVQEHDRCWNCGWPYIADWQRDWMLPKLDVAHLLGGPARRHDRRALARLCAGCHGLTHGDTIRVGPIVLPRLTLANLLYLKMVHDADWYDPVFLNTIAGRALPEPAPPPTWPDLTVAA